MRLVQAILLLAIIPLIVPGTGATGGFVVRERYDPLGGGNPTVGQPDVGAPDAGLGRNQGGTWYTLHAPVEATTATIRVKDALAPHVRFNACLRVAPCLVRGANVVYGAQDELTMVAPADTPIHVGTAVRVQILYAYGGALTPAADAATYGNIEVSFDGVPAPFQGAPTDEPPALDFPMPDLWVVHRQMGLFPWTATACDAEGRLDGLFFNSESDGHGGVVGMPDGVGCFSVDASLIETNVDKRHASNASTVVSAWDKDGHRVDLATSVRYGLLPLKTDSIPGFPDLGQFPAKAPGETAVITIAVTPEGAARAYKLVWGGVTHANTFATTTPVAGELNCQITIAPSSAKLQCGPDIWHSDKFAYAGTGPWWNVEPPAPTVNPPVGVNEAKQMVTGPYA